MNIGIVGLGLIGGSLARSIKKNTEHQIFAFDADDHVLSKAFNEPVIDGVLTDNKLKHCDVILVALYPQKTIEYVVANQSLFKENSIIVDMAGTKERVTEVLFKTARENNYEFFGGHPMAGIEKFGFGASKDDLFDGASFILTPDINYRKSSYDLLNKLFLNIGFAEIVTTTPAGHDRIIAYTSQLAHVVSSAYVKSPEAGDYKGFSAGSFKDLTRVAKLNEEMWCQLFMENKGNLINEINNIITELEKYRVALEDADRIRLKQLLKDGRMIKENLENS